MRRSSLVAGTRPFVVLLVALSAGIFAVGACGDTASDSPTADAGADSRAPDSSITTGVPDASDAGVAPADATNASDAPSPKDAALPIIDADIDPPLPDGGKTPGRIYAHTAKALYLFDPVAKALQKIGDFGGLDPAPEDDVIDIALDHDSMIYGTTRNGFVRIDPIDAKVTYVKRDGLLKYPDALTFVAAGTVDPTKEALVGYKVPDTGGGTTDYVRIDLSTGAITKLGDLNAPGAAVLYESAGDIYAMERNGRAFAAVKTIVPDAGTGTDQFAEIDMKTGRIKQLVGDIGQAETRGLAQWVGTAYGFDAKGNIVEINQTTGKGTKIVPLTTVGGGAASWSGAGVTTDAPTKP